MRSEAKFKGVHHFCPTVCWPQFAVPILLFHEVLMKHLPFVLLLALPCASCSAAYPERAVRMMVPFPPGGANDIVARLVTQKLSERWGKPVVIDNRAGAGGNIGTEIGARACCRPRPRGLRRAVQLHPGGCAWCRSQRYLRSSAVRVSMSESCLAMALMRSASMMLLVP
mgnify:CR=1 FL=1